MVRGGGGGGGGGDRTVDRKDNRSTTDLCSYCALVIDAQNEHQVLISTDSLKSIGSIIDMQDLDQYFIRPLIMPQQI